MSDTLRQRAEQLVKLVLDREPHMGCKGVGGTHFDLCVKDIHAALEQVVREERERCAK